MTTRKRTAQGLNPVLLKLDLLSLGIRPDPESGLSAKKGFSGEIELLLPSGIRIKTAIDEKVAEKSPYSFFEREGEFYIGKDDQAVSRVEVSRAGLDGFVTGRGTPMERVGRLDGSSLEILPLGDCSYFRPDGVCGLCRVAGNRETGRGGEKDLRDVIDTIETARSEYGIRRVRFVAGFAHGMELDQIEVYLRAVRHLAPLSLGVQAPPHADLRRYDRLREMGVEEVVFQLGFYRPDFFRRFCPGFDQDDLRDAYLKALEYCAGTWRRGSVIGGVTVGVEPLEITMNAVDHMIRIGAIPHLLVLPQKWLDDQKLTSQRKSAAVAEILKRQFRGCRKRWLRLETWPGTERATSITPYDSRLLDDRGPGRAAYLAWLALLRNTVPRYRDLRKRLALRG